ncbi:autotransporter assembly complex protein TamA [Lentilitoribacter sp. EG35]|uniref:autotransporter assembly complex protein TamA n=1 Tax=Lentilitoribacter sp. EG35 TaxID=3234192 RepID=UPI003460A89E
MTKSRKAMLASWIIMLNVVALPQAGALELFGFCLSGSCKNAEGDNADVIDPKSYTVQFTVHGVASQDLENSLKLTSELVRGEDKAVAGAAGLITRAKGDYRRILAGLYNEGFYGGEISIRVNGRQASDLKPGDEIPNNSTVQIKVDSGNIYRFGKFEIFNQAPDTTDKGDIVERPTSLFVATGDIAKAGHVGSAARFEIERWRQQGYPNAKIGTQSVKARHDENILNVSLSIDPGLKATYGDVTVDGAENVDRDFIEYMIGLRSGQEYDPDDIERAKKRLDKLDVFSVRKVETGENMNSDGSIPINASVKEKKPRRVGLGATLSSTDGVGLSAFWLHRNLLGKAERLRVEGEIGGLGSSFNVNQLDFKLGATFTKPGVFTPNTTWISNLFAAREFNTAFEGETGGGSSVLSHIYTDEISVEGGGFYEYSRFKDAFGTRNFSTLGLTGNVTFDGRDSKIEPTDGIFAKLDAKPFYETKFKNAGARVNAEVRAYYAVDKEAKTVLAARAKIGTLVGPTRSEVPTNFLYLAGGGGSARGFGFNNIGITDNSGNVSGGRSVLETSVELRQKLNDSFGVVAFTDAAVVGKDPIIDFSQDFRVSAGLGVRYYTGLGPIRVDVAVPINPKSGDPKFGIFAGIGQAF